MLVSLSLRTKAHSGIKQSLTGQKTFASSSPKNKFSKYLLVVELISAHVCQCIKQPQVALYVRFAIAWTFAMPLE